MIAVVTVQQVKVYVAAIVEKSNVSNEKFGWFQLT